MKNNGPVGCYVLTGTYFAVVTLVGRLVQANGSGFEIRIVLFKASNSLVRKPDAPATETKLAYCSRRRSPNELSRRRQSAIRSLSRHENDTFRRPLIFICNLSRSGIASPCCENRDFLSFENDDKTRRM